MKLVKPTAITDSNLTSSNVTEADYAAWNSSTAYVAGNRVIVVATHKIYESLTSNTNKYPPSYLTGTTPDWLEVGATTIKDNVQQRYKGSLIR